MKNKRKYLFLTNKKMEKELLLKLIDLVVNGKEEKKEHPYINKYVIIRGKMSGVWAGVLANATPGMVILRDARMLRYRRASEGTGLSGLSETGMNLEKKNQITINKQIKEVMITEEINTIFKTTDFVEKQIRSREIG